MTKYVSAAQLAERYSVSTDSIWRWASKGRLPRPVQLSPSCTRWRLDEVEAMEAARAKRSDAPSAA